MSTLELAQSFGFLGASFFVGLSGGLLPLINIEIFLLAAAAIASPPSLFAIVALTAAGQMAAKSLLYLAGSGVVRLPHARRYEVRLLALTARLTRRPKAAAAIVFTSAAIGFPPFYLVSVAAGTARFSLTEFLLVGGCGNLLRFGAVVTLSRALWVAAG